MSMASLRTLKAMFDELQNPVALCADRLKLKRGTYVLRTRDGAKFLVRSGTSDRYSVLEVAVRRDYFQRHTIPPGATVVDVGANIGVFTIMAARMVGPTGRVVAIEPNPETADHLERNLALNGITNVSVHRCAITASARDVLLHVGTKPLFSAIVGVDGRALSGQAVPVAGRPLADILASEGLDRVDLIKIDCEGGEYEILDSAGPELWAKLPAIVMEVHRLPDRRPAELEKALEAANYRVVAQEAMLYADRAA